MHQSLVQLPLFGADVFYLEKMDLPDTPEAILDALVDSISWRQETVTVHGRRYPQPRLTSWHGDPGMAYTYSGLSLEPQPWTPLLALLKGHAENLTGSVFNSGLLNLYSNERSSIGFHSDNEPELGTQPTIASLSFGEERTFILKPRWRKDLPPVKIPLASGSLLVMAGQTQKNWLHGIEKEQTPKGPRVNITFRRIFPR